MDQTMLYNLIYALAARDGREEALFGHSAPLALEAFGHSLAGSAFPELWFEIPLAADPWFDFHALTSRGTVESLDGLPASTHGAFRWFAEQGKNVRQLALSWDTGSGNPEDPAIQLLVAQDDPETTCAFLEAAGKADAAPAFRAFRKRLPQGWFACYMGVFPQRPEFNLRVECIPDPELQRAYAKDPDLLRSHLESVGISSFGDTVIPRCQLMCSMPFQFEFQFDVDESGLASSTLGASSRFACPPGEDDWAYFDTSGSAGDLMRRVEEWGLADSRWSLLGDTAFATRATQNGKSTTLYCYPAFLKLRWRDGEPLDAKAYLIAGVQTAQDERKDER